MISTNALEEFLQYIEYVYQNYDSLTIKENLSDEEKIIANLACLIEEVWEVSSELRKYTKLSFNKNKVDNFKKEDLEDEFVDVLITTFSLMKSVGIINMDNAIKRKIATNNVRGY